MDALAAPSREVAGRPIRVLIVDDSAVARAVLTRMVATHGAFEIAGSVAGAGPAIHFLADNRVDIILLDIEMPGLDGLTALPELLRRSAGARVLIVSSIAEAGATATMRALELGAADTLAKPGLGVRGGRFAQELVTAMLRLGHAPALRPVPAPAPGPGSEPETPLPPLRAPVEGPVAMLGIGASTGGIHALSELLRGLPATFDAPILITQHLPSAFMPFFAAQVAQLSGRQVGVARDGETVQAGRVYIAPGDAHLCLQRRGARVFARLDRRIVTSGCKPSVDPMFEAMGEVFGSGALGIVLSGMGKDGMVGAGRLVSAGGDVIVQDKASSVIWGMPGAVAGAGYASAVMPPRKIAVQIMRRATK